MESLAYGSNSMAGAMPAIDAAHWSQERAVWKLCEIARAMRCNESTVRLWCQQGILSAYKTRGKRGHYRVTAESLRAYVTGASESIRAA